MGFLFSIHDLCSSQIESLESLTHSYLKKWLGIPKGGTWALVHDPHGLGIKSIRHFYLESRSLSLVTITCATPWTSRKIEKADGLASSLLRLTQRAY